MISEAFKIKKKVYKSASPLWHMGTSFILSLRVFNKIQQRIYGMTYEGKLIYGFTVHVNIIYLLMRKVEFNYAIGVVIKLFPLLQWYIGLVYVPLGDYWVRKT